MQENWRIVTPPGVFTEGLFGQVVWWVFEVLPALYQAKLFPDWRIASRVYGQAPDFTVIPGVFDLAYEPKKVPRKDIDLRKLGTKYVQALGNQFDSLSRVWKSYFQIPERISRRADQFGDLGRALGLHYRGNDKSEAAGLSQTNPVSRSDFLALTDVFLTGHPDVDTIVIASDDHLIKDMLKVRGGNRRIVDTGEVGYFRDQVKGDKYAKADHAILDCLLLSRCKYMLKNQSALSGFSKILNPQLEAYRVAASKFFTDMPYFPDAFIPQISVSDPVCREILHRQMKGDWTESKQALAVFGKPFVSMRRRSIQWRFTKYLYWAPADARAAVVFATTFMDRMSAAKNSSKL